MPHQPVHGVMRIRLDERRKARNGAGNKMIRTSVSLTMALAIQSFLPIHTAAAHQLKVLYSFCAKTNCTDGANPVASLVRDDNGNLYGTTAQGGNHVGEGQASGDGVVFKIGLDPVTNLWRYEPIYKFCKKTDCSDGRMPNASLIIDIAGNLYGTAVNGGKNGSSNGVIFELSPRSDRKSWAYKVLYDFCSKANCIDGSTPMYGLTYRGADSGLPYDGTSPLYGTTPFGGEFGSGTAFELSPGSSLWEFKTIWPFCSVGDSGCLDGISPGSTLSVGAAGNLFGTTQGGGEGAAGTAFELSRKQGTWSLKTLHNFCVDDCSDGSLPSSTLLSLKDGSFLGVTSNDGGTGEAGLAYRLTPDAEDWSFSSVYAFCSQAACSDGMWPKGNLVLDGKQPVGTAQYGGNPDIDGGNGGGLIFSLLPKYKVLYRFCSLANCSDGERPLAGVITGEAGHLFGTTVRGGAADQGVIFEYIP